MMQVCEVDGRLILEFRHPKPCKEPGLMSIETVVYATIDITAHIERAVENVLNRRAI